MFKKQQQKRLQEKIGQKIYKEVGNNYDFNQAKIR